ncbi:MAG: phosphatase PAP2 family protein [Anaerolineae bacterium]|nr:phosphatase PAP2 family protein [Anaerolineae bacterium]
MDTLLYAQFLRVVNHNRLAWSKTSVYHFITVLTEFDERLSQRLRIARQNRPTWTLAVFLAHSGDSWFWLIGLILVWLFGSTLWHNLAAFMAISLTAEAVLVLAIKFMVRRSRPPGEWGAIYRNTDPHSFPSGHAARACLLAVISAALAPAWFGWLLILWAPLVCLSRVALGVHYLSDILVGMIIGLISGWVAVALHPTIIANIPLLFR